MNSYFKTLLKSLTILHIDIEQKDKLFLESISKEVYLAKDEQEAYKLYKQYHPSIIITDVELINSNGIDLIKLIRQDDKEIPIIIYSSSTDSKYLIPAISLKLIDYLVKPATHEIILKSLTKAIEQVILMNKSTYIFNNGIHFDINKKVIYKDNEETIISSNEYKLLAYLIKNSHRTISSEELELAIWDTSIVTNLALRSLVSRLRKKIGNKTIVNIPNLGYTIKVHN